MQIIPVIDIKAGLVVLAKQGQRQKYRPLSTPLCNSSQISDVIDAYLGIYSFTHFYIADLDALMNTGSNDELINSVFSRYPHINFIIDCGSIKSKHSLLSARHTAIIGTESITKHDLITIKQTTENFILSLDFSAQHKKMGDPLLYKSPSLWPKSVIIMTLGRVGKNSGPDLIRLEYYRRHYPQHDFIAAGGIRHKQDLLQLKGIGIKTALVASALHNGSLTNQDIQKLRGTT